MENKCLNILLVEDSNVDREIFKQKFKEAGFISKLTECENAEEALKLLDMGSLDFDIAVIDHTLSGKMSGLELCRKIKGGTSDLPLVLLTGTGSEEIAVEAFKIGIEEYIIKGGEAHQHTLALHIQKAFLNHQEHTNRIKAEKKLHLFKNALDTTHTGITITDLDGTIIYSNSADAKMHGYSDSEILGMKGKQFADSSLWQNIKRSKLSGVKNWGRESINTRKDKSIFPVYLVSDAIKDEFGEAIAIVTSCTDISIQKQAEELIEKSRDDLSLQVEERTYELEAARKKAESSNKFKSLFLANMSHEIRTPMTSIFGMAELLSETKLSSEQNELVECIIKSGDSLIRIINDILDLSKVEAGLIELEEINFSLTEEVERIFSIFNVKAANKGILLKIIISPHVPEYVLGDPVRLRQVFVNLIGNAIKFTNSGEICISVDCGVGTSNNDEAYKLVIYVSDTGIGIPEQKRLAIFEEFYQADPSTTRKYGGTGLGLTISRKLVELMGGTLEVRSKEGEGCTFFFTLSVKAGYKEEDLHEEPDLRPKGKEQAFNILLAEDIEDNRLLVENFLKNSQHKLDIAKNGEEAVEMFTSGEYNLVLMDMQMPVMDGYMATKIIREWEMKNQKKETSIVAFTAHALKEEVEECLSAGCTSHLAKPLRKKALMKIIASTSLFDSI